MGNKDVRSVLGRPYQNDTLEQETTVEESNGGILQSQAFKDEVRGVMAEQGTADVHEHLATIGEVKDFKIIGTPRQVADLFEALAHAKGEFEAIQKTRHVDVTKQGQRLYSFDYAPLDEVIAKTDPALAKHGLAIIQPLARPDVDGNLSLRTMLVHAAGAVMLSVVTFRAGEDLQKTGSAMTYLMRYSRVSLLGVASETDDDGNAAIGNEATPQPRNRQQPPKPPTAAKPQAPKGEPAPKKAPEPAPKPAPAPEPKPEPARAKSTPPPPAEDPRQIHIPGADIDRETIPTPPDTSLMKDPVELKDGTWVDRAVPVAQETFEAILSIRESLGISKEVAKRLALEVTGHMFSDVAKCDGMAKALLYYFQDVANGDRELPEWVGQS